MSMHKIPLTQLEEDGLRAHGLDIGTPSQLSDVFRQGIKWALEQTGQQPELTVWEGAMPESNGKSNFTAVLMRKGAGLFDGISGGMTIARSEYPDRVRYEADCVRWLIGELKEQPCILDYDADKHSGYAAPIVQAEQQPIGWITEDYLTDKSATTYSLEVAERWRAKGWPVSEIYSSPPLDRDSL